MGEADANRFNPAPAVRSGVSWDRFIKRDPGRRMRARDAEFIGVVLVTGAVWHALARHGGLLEFGLSLLSLAMLWTASIVLHEIGHVVAASAVDLEPIAVVAGGGPRLLRREAFGVAFDLGWLPGSGLTVVVGREGQQRVKWRLLACYMGGPLVSIGLLLAGLVVSSENWNAFRTEADTWITPGVALVLANGFIVFTSTVPMPRASDVASMRNDLVQMVTLPWLKASSLAALARAAAAAKFARLCVLGNYDAAFDEGRQRLAVDPGNWTVRLQLAHLLIFAGRYAEAAVEYGILLAEPALYEEGVPPLLGAFVANNYALAIYMLNEPDRLEAADQASSKALAAAPDNPSVLGTRGAILVEQGKVEVGRKLLKRALRLHRDRLSRASTLACLALASVREGALKDSRRLLDRARRLDRDCELLARVEGALSNRPNIASETRSSV